jgi:hypothetical protein
MRPETLAMPEGAPKAADVEPLPYEGYAWAALGEPYPPYVACEGVVWPETDGYVEEKNWRF